MPGREASTDGRRVMDHALPVDPVSLRLHVREKYRQVAENPSATFHFHTGRRLAARLGYDEALLAKLPDHAVEAFAGVANPFSAGAIEPGSRVVDVGSGGGFDSIVAAAITGPSGRVVGVDMTPEMLERSRRSVASLDIHNVEFREGMAEELPVEDGWADVVISNGVLNLVADKRRAFAEIFRVIRPGGVVQLADIANGKPVPESAIRDIDLWCG